MKQIHILFASALMLLSTLPGLSYYNPNTGKWLNRDPLGEQGSLNLTGFVGNAAPNRTDLLGLVIVCSCPEAYFSRNGITPAMYTKTGDTYSAKGPKGPTSGAGEILWKMLQSTEKFTAKGKKGAELENHVNARLNAIAETANVGWNFGSDRGFNFLLWANEHMTEQDAAAAVSDMFSENAVAYTRACHWTAMMVLLKGALDTVGARDFNAAVGGGKRNLVTKAFSAGTLREYDSRYTQYDKMPPKAWIPGDVGHVQGKNRDPIYEGEWIVYVGGDSYWGWGLGTLTIQQFIDRVSGWRDDPRFRVFVHPKRQYPGVGLQ